MNIAQEISVVTVKRFGLELRATLLTGENNVKIAIFDSRFGYRNMFFKTLEQLRDSEEFFLENYGYEVYLELFNPIYTALYSAFGESKFLPFVKKRGIQLKEKVKVLDLTANLVFVASYDILTDWSFKKFNVTNAEELAKMEYYLMNTLEVPQSEVWRFVKGWHENK